jgi:hypothetical protein
MNGLGVLPHLYRKRDQGDDHCYSANHPAQATKLFNRHD